MPRVVNKAGFDLVREFEGFCPDAYRCPSGKLTVGFGHTKGVTHETQVSRDEAEELLREDLREAGEKVSMLITVPLNDNQFAALSSFVFNFGPLALLQSTLRKKLNQGEYDAVPEQLKRWTKARHPHSGEMVDLPGLIRRRAAEAELWSTPT